MGHFEKTRQGVKVLRGTLFVALIAVTVLFVSPSIVAPSNASQSFVPGQSSLVTFRNQFYANGTNWYPSNPGGGIAFWPQGWHDILATPLTSGVQRTQGASGEIFTLLGPSINQQWWAGDTDCTVLSVCQTFVNLSYNSTNYGVMFNFLTKGMGFNSWLMQFSLEPEGPAGTNNMTEAQVNQWLTQTTSPGGEWWAMDQFMNYADGTGFKVIVDVGPGITVCSLASYSPNFNTTLTFAQQFFQRYGHHSSLFGVSLQWTEGDQGQPNYPINTTCSPYESYFFPSSLDQQNVVKLLNIARNYGRQVFVNYNWGPNLIAQGFIPDAYDGTGWDTGAQPWNSILDHNSTIEGFGCLCPGQPWYPALCPPPLSSCSFEAMLNMNKPVWIDGSYNFALRSNFIKYMVWSSWPWSLFLMNYIRNPNIYYPGANVILPNDWGDYLYFLKTADQKANAAGNFQIKNSTARVDSFTFSGNTMTFRILGYDTKYWYGWTYNATIALSYPSNYEITDLSTGRVVSTATLGTKSVAVVSIPFAANTTDICDYGSNAGQYQNSPCSDINKTITVTFGTLGNPSSFCVVGFSCGAMSLLILFLATFFGSFFSFFLLYKRKSKSQLSGDLKS